MAHERESEQQRARHFREILDAMPQIAWTARPDGFRDYYNRRWYELTGISGRVSEQEQWLTALHDEDRVRVVEAWFEAVRGGTPYEIECRYWVPAADRHCWYLSRALPVRDHAGAIVRWIGTSTDIDRQKRLEAEREQLLEAERAARAELQRADLVKDEFLATLGHELRTPLNAIMGWSQLLCSGKLSEADSRKGVQVIARNASAQSRLIADLLDLSRIVSGRLRLERQPVDPSAFAAAAVEALGPMAEERGVEIVTALPALGPVLHGDPTRLEQVAWNLVSNGIKFTPAGGRVEVAVVLEAEHVLFVVRDTGQGIVPEFLPSLFDRFTQGDPSISRRQGGLGLGLSIVKQLVELHGGTVRGESAGPGAGAVFTVELPLARPTASEYGPQPARTEPAARATMDLAGMRVLVVDDEDDARELVRRVLEAGGAAVECADDGEHALRVLERFDADVLVCDIDLPGENGDRLLARMRETRARALPAIALTAFARPEDRARATAAGFQAHVPKPLEPAHLLATIGRVWRA